MVSSIVSQKILANGSTVYGQVVTVTEDTYSPPLPGLGDKAVSVSVSGTQDRAAFSAGFVSTQDVKKFLHGIGDEPFTVYTADGNERQEVRKCLGIPRGMVSDFGEDAPEFTVPFTDGDEVVPTVTEPGANQTTLSLTTKEAQRQGEVAAKDAKESETKPTDVPSKDSNANRSKN